MKKRISIIISMMLSALIMFSSLPAAATTALAAEGLTINKQELLLATGETEILTVSGESSNVVWTSSNDAVATVDETGSITALTYGEAVIVATDGEASASCVVRTQYNDVLADSVSKGAYKAIYWAADMGITKGHGNVTFGPAETATRQQFAIFMWRLAGSPDTALPATSPFSDITPATTGYKAIIWAVNNGIIKGYKDGTFKPANEVLRKEVVIMLWRFAGKPAANTALDFSDVSETSSAAPAIAWGSESGIVKGFSDGTFVPDNTCLRQEIAIFLYRYYNAYLNENPETGFDALPAGTYTYVNAAPKADVDSEKGQIQFLYAQDKLIYAFGSDEVQTGEMILTGFELKFLQGLYLSNLPVTDWLGGGPKDTEGYFGDVADHVDITITEDGKISVINVTYAGVRVDAVLDSSITADQLKVIGITRGRPNLLQSCITLVGSVNGLYLTRQGDVILAGLEIGHDTEGVGLRGDKIGGDTFVAGTVKIDGTVEWHGLMGVITALSSQPGTILTTGKDINMTGGSNIGRVGRCLNISTGEGGGDINLGVDITADQSRGGMMASDGLSDYLTISTTGAITAGEGNVTIGTYTKDNKGLVIDTIGDISGANVTIAPYDYGKLNIINNAIGNITASGNIDIKADTINSGAGVVTIISSSDGSQAIPVVSEEAASTIAIGNITADGDIDFDANSVFGTMGNVTAGGTINIRIGGVVSIGEVKGETVNSDITLFPEAENDD